MRDVDALAKPDDVVEPEQREMLVANLVTESPIRQERDGDLLGQAGVKQFDRLVFVTIPVIGERLAAHGLPHQRCGATMPCNQVQADC